jgi:hypothetical protein
MLRCTVLSSLLVNRCVELCMLTADDDAHTCPDLPQALCQLGTCVLDLQVQQGKGLV